MPEGVKGHRRQVLRVAIGALAIDHTRVLALLLAAEATVQSNGR
jgi:hypothetical protein